MTARFRLTLGVADVGRAVGFYQTFFAREPAAVTPAGARFELTDPPLDVTLVKRPPDRLAVVGSPGLRLPDRAAVVALRERLTRAGLKTHTQECTHCGYNEQFRVHVGDPDGNYWSVYAVERVIHPSAIHRCLEGPEAVLPPDPVTRSWAAAAGEIPVTIPHPDGSLDAARLAGVTAGLAGETFRAVRPGGTVRADEAAGAVDRLHTAGFRGLEVRGGEVTGYKPEAAPAARTRLVLYKGPFRTARDDSGNVYLRGRRVAVDEATWVLLRRGAVAEQFLFLFPFGYPERGPVRPPTHMPEEVET
ncbi:MAG TPA: VOC family protein [Urbifossiella sp.]|jgi:hypothetical protein|nr:VOC family protein [Urbifossiella sp.]